MTTATTHETLRFSCQEIHGKTPVDLYNALASSLEDMAKYLEKVACQLYGDAAAQRTRAQIESRCNTKSE